jgi:hypothetical protein
MRLLLHGYLDRRSELERSTPIHPDVMQHKTFGIIPAHISDYFVFSKAEFRAISPP